MNMIPADSVSAESRLSSVFLAAMGSVFLLYTGPDGYAHIVESKYAAFCLLCGLYLAAMLFVFLQRLFVGAARRERLKNMLLRTSWTQRFVFAYLMLTWISAFASRYFPQTLVGMSRYEGALTLTLYCLIFFCISACAPPGRWVLWVFGAAITLQNMLCIAQLTGANPLSLYPEGYSWFDAGVRYSGAYLGTIGNTGLLGAVYCIAIPIFLLGLFKLRGWIRFFLLFPLMSSIYVAARMDVLACFAGLGGGLAVYSFIALPRTGKGRRTACIFAVCAAAAAFGIVFFFDSGTGFFHEIHELLHGRAQPGFGSGRLYIWENVLRLVPRHLAFGAGPDTMIAAGIEPFTRWDEDLGRLLTAHIDAAHSEYLNILYHQGAFALAACLTAIGFGLWRWGASPVRRPEADGIAAAVTCYAVQALFGISMCLSAPYFWISLGLLEAYASQARYKRDSRPDTNISV